MSDGAVTKDLDVVVLGATGLTGRLVAAHLAERAPHTGARWAVAGRSPDRLARVLVDVGAPGVPTLVVDLRDTDGLAAMARRTRVVLNLAGPYSRTAEAVVAACVTGGASYVDLSGEVPSSARVVQRWHQAAAAAGVKVVQTCGYEALPTDLAVLAACEEAELPGTGPVVSVQVSVGVVPPARRMSLSDAVSGGTLASLVAALGDDDARVIADPAALVPDPATAALVRRRSPLRLRPRASGGRVLGPVVPAAFINPPVVHRTAVLRATGRDQAPSPFAFAEGADLGAAGGPGGVVRLALAGVLGAGQAAVLAAARLPRPARRLLVSGLGRVLPGSGTGPTGPSTEDWRWDVRATAVTADGTRGEAAVEARGHPGYAATARMLGEVGLLLSEPGSTPPGSGCLTPALAVGTAAAQRLTNARVDLTSWRDRVRG